jgi:hypothetical protein
MLGGLIEVPERVEFGQFDTVSFGAPLDDLKGHLATALDVNYVRYMSPFLIRANWKMGLVQSRKIILQAGLN